MNNQPDDGNGTVRKIYMNTGTDPSVPSYDIAIIDGQPEMMVNMALVAEMVRHSPLGIDKAFTAAVEAIGHHDQLRALVYGEDR